MYYLQSRYYDPSVGRFINADSAEYIGASGTILGCNLFAYCENNVVNYLDSIGLAKESIRDRYKKNMKVSWDLKYGVYINNQSSSTIAKLRYGNYDSSYNGCGWIAVYNVLTFFGYNTHPAGIIKVLESQGALIDNGKYGTDFYALRLCFQAPSIRITEIGLFDLLMIDNLFRTKPSYKKALIVWIAFAFGMHYYTITYDSEYNVFRAYNCANDLGPVSSLLDIILNDGGAFVSAWYITYDTGFHW